MILVKMMKIGGGRGSSGVFEDNDNVVDSDWTNLFKTSKFQGVLVGFEPTLWDNQDKKRH